MHAASRDAWYPLWQWAREGLFVFAGVFYLIDKLLGWLELWDIMLSNQDGGIAPDVAGNFGSAFFYFKGAEAAQIDVVSTGYGALHYLKERLNGLLDHYFVQSRLHGDFIYEVSFCHFRFLFFKNG